MPSTTTLPLRTLDERGCVIVGGVGYVLAADREFWSHLIGKQVQVWINDTGSKASIARKDEPRVNGHWLTAVAVSPS